MGTLLVFVLIVAIVAVGTILLTSLRRGGVIAPAGDHSRAQSAYPYEGMIVGFEERGNGRDGRGAYRTVDFAFEILPPGEAPYQTRTTWKVYARSPDAQALQLGHTVAIKVDLDDPLIIYPDLPGVEYDWGRAQALQRR
jgi:hypothetical protein